MTDKIELKRRSNRHETNKSSNKFKTFFLRISIVLFVCFTALFVIGFVKKGNIDKINNQPKSFPVTIQNQGVLHVEN